VALMRRVLLSASQSAWLRDHAMRWPFVRRATRRFMPGETLDDAIAATRVLEGERITTILTRLGENVTRLEEAGAVTEHYASAQERLRETGLRSEMSVKLTQLGLDQSPDVAAASLERLAAQAETIGRRVWVDMEGSDYTARTLELYHRVRARHANVGIAIQAYLKRTPADLDALIARGAAIRLVKGAYDEPASVALRERAGIDAAYLRLGQRMLSAEARAAGVFAAFGTHDHVLIERLARVADEGRVPPEAYEFEMLYGIRHELQSRLAREGRPVRVLISYGEAWFPWYMRRLAEKPANVWFVLRNAVGG